MKTIKTLFSIFLVMLSVQLMAQQNSKEKNESLLNNEYTSYLFTYFTGNRMDEEQIHFAVSKDGLNFKALNYDRPVLSSAQISSTGGVRDPHILRGHDGKTFYMVVTDMVSANGWNSNRAMVLLKSKDLVHWSSSVVNIQKKYSEQEHLKRVWAPQTIYDRQAGKYMIYWSMLYEGKSDIIYYAYANESFTDIVGKPKQLFFPKNGKSCIDGDMIYKDGLYHLFYKTEGSGNGIKKATSSSLTSGKWDENDQYLQMTKEPVEGSSIFKRIDSDSYVLMYDMYSKGKYQFTKTNDLNTFAIIDQPITMDFHPRHGTIIAITEKEEDRLMKEWGQEFNATIQLKSNPVLKGYYADPDVLYSNKTGKYYIYPTSDGFDGWSGTYFKTFSSTNMVDWNDEGVILDLKKDVSWANRNAWAPCIIEKKVGKEYKYYYYFTAAQKIGVAIASNPEGPFKDSGKALVDAHPKGVSRGQEIDPDVFEDPKTKKSYLYWGNGYMAVAELNDDMISIKQNTTKIITPDETFREGTTVLYRNGLYYFLWSEDDTRSENYRVRYGISKSPTGPIETPDHNLILFKDASKGIYATGHNSVVQVPGKDEWYIVYHRFCRPEGIKMGDAAGFHREVCIDRLQFDSNNKILIVTPTE